MDNEPPARKYFLVNEMGNKEFTWSGLKFIANDFFIALVYWGLMSVMKHSGSSKYHILYWGQAICQFLILQYSK